MTTKKIVGVTSLFVSLLFTVLFISCSKDSALVKNGTLIEPCKNIVCYNGGACNNGKCICPVGFEGIDCIARWNDTYPGVYLSKATTDNDTLNVNITAEVGKPTKIIFDGLNGWCPNQGYVANIENNSNSFVFPKQKVCNETYVTGRGTQNVERDIINIYLEARDSVNHTTVTSSINLKRK